MYVSLRTSLLPRSNIPLTLVRQQALFHIITVYLTLIFA